MAGSIRPLCNQIICSDLVSVELLAAASLLSLSLSIYLSRPVFLYSLPSLSLFSLLTVFLPLSPSSLSLFLLLSLSAGSLTSIRPSPPISLSIQAGLM